MTAETPTGPLHDEHRELLAQVERLRAVAGQIGTSTLDTLRADLGIAHSFLATRLIPHALAEDRVLYPVVAKLLGGPRATATMSRDHVEVGRLTEELDALRAIVGGSELDAFHAGELRRVLYGLYALVKTHFAKEEEIYLPLLDERLTLDEGRALFAKMERAAVEAQARTA